MSMLDFLAGKADSIKKYRTHDSDSGSVFVQLALLCLRIDYLSQHTAAHKGDHSAKRSLLRLIQKRRKLLKGAFSVSKDRYHQIISDFGIRDSLDKRHKVAASNVAVAVQ